jgi:redox-sensing transcriptional repressor
MEIPPVVIDRLPQYARALSKLQEGGREVVSSQELGSMLGVTPAQIRKDLSYFGRFGKQGRGYNIRKLLDELRRILGLDRQWRMALVGVGKLGRAILGYGGFGPQGFRIVEAFDVDAGQVGEQIYNLTVKDVADLEKVLSENPVDVGIVAVPADVAQDVIDSLVKCGVRAILNYAPIAARVPPDIRIKRIEPVLALQSMTYYMKNANSATASSRN